jgi:hypothetical protein
MWKKDLLIDITFNPCLFSLDSPFNTVPLFADFSKLQFMHQLNTTVYRYIPSSFRDTRISNTKRREHSVEPHG